MIGATSILKSSVASPSAAAVCAHCGEPVPQGGDARFCCAGCAAAFEIIRELGLEKFYVRLARSARQRALRPEDDSAVDYAAFARTDSRGETTLHLMIDGLHCAACVWLIESVLARVPGVLDGRVNMTTRRLMLRWRGTAELAPRFAHKVAALGYRLVPFDPTLATATGDTRERELLRALAVAGFAAANVMLLSVSVWSGQAEVMGPATRDLMHWLSALIALPAIAYAGRPFFRSALAALSAGRTNMDVPISIGVILAAGMSLFETLHSGPHAYFDSAVTLLFFLLVGRYLDIRARGRVRVAAEQLVTLGVRMVTVVAPDGSLKALAPAAIRSGDIVLVAAGERIGVDGRVIEGRSDLDASLVSGESNPVAATIGTPVFAGTLNLTAPLRIEVTASGEGTLLAEIVRLMEAAERARARHAVLADRIARRYAPVVHATALLTFVGWMLLGDAPWQQALLNAIAVLIITCPCALALAVPVVQVVASGRLMRGGILVKSGSALERLASVDTVVFDKTGTLTLGRPELANLAAIDPACLGAAAALARTSRHPLARALARAAGPGAPAAGVEELPGQGLRRVWSAGEERLGSRAYCGVDSNSRPAPSAPELWYLRTGGAAVGFSFADHLRSDASSTIAGLVADGYRIALLSGDRPEVVSDIARQVGIADWRGGVDPAGKCAWLAERAGEGRRTLMVGDGLNDAPALAAATVSMSPSSAIDISQNAADLVFQGERLAAVDIALAVARRAMRLVRQNLALALVYNLAAVPLAILGYVTPLLAAAAMSSSSLLVIGNALRLSRGRAR